MPAIALTPWAGTNALRGLAAGGTRLSFVPPASGDEGLHVLARTEAAGRHWSARTEPARTALPEEMAPLAFPLDEIEFDIHEPALLDFPAGPTVHATLVFGGPLEPLPFPIEDLEGTEWEEE